MIKPMYASRIAASWAYEAHQLTLYLRNNPTEWRLRYRLKILTFLLSRYGGREDLDWQASEPLPPRFESLPRAEEIKPLRDGDRWHKSLSQYAGANEARYEADAKQKDAPHPEPLFTISKPPAREIDLPLWQFLVCPILLLVTSPFLQFDVPVSLLWMMLTLGAVNTVRGFSLAFQYRRKFGGSLWKIAVTPINEAERHDTLRLFLVVASGACFYLYCVLRTQDVLGLILLTGIWTLYGYTLQRNDDEDGSERAQKGLLGPVLLLIGFVCAGACRLYLAAAQSHGLLLLVLAGGTAMLWALIACLMKWPSDHWLVAPFVFSPRKSFFNRPPAECSPQYLEHSRRVRRCLTPLVMLIYRLYLSGVLFFLLIAVIVLIQAIVFALYLMQLASGGVT